MEKRKQRKLKLRLVEWLFRGLAALLAGLILLRPVALAIQASRGSVPIVAQASSTVSPESLKPLLQFKEPPKAAPRNGPRPETTLEQNQIPEPQVTVEEVVVRGKDGELFNLVNETSKTLLGKVTTRSKLQADINTILKAVWFLNVKPILEETSFRVRVTFEFQPIVFRGIRLKNSDRLIAKSLKVAGQEKSIQAIAEASFAPLYGQMLSPAILRRGVDALLQVYKANGFTKTTATPEFLTSEASKDGILSLTITEGVIDSTRVAFLDLDESGKSIYEEPTDSCLTTPPTQFDPLKIKAKVGALVNEKIIQKDLERLKKENGVEIGAYRITAQKVDAPVFYGGGEVVQTGNSGIQRLEGGQTRIPVLGADEPGKFVVTFVLGNKLSALQLPWAKALAAAEQNNNGCRVQAIRYYQDALKLQSNKETTALIWNNIGNLYKQVTESSSTGIGPTESNYQAALNAYHNALPTFQQKKATFQEAALSINVAQIYRDVGKLEQALQLYNQVLPTIRLLKQNPKVSHMLGISGRLNYGYISWFMQYLEIGLLFDLATTYASFGDYQQAVYILQKYESATKNFNPVLEEWTAQLPKSNPTESESNQQNIRFMKHYFLSWFKVGFPILLRTVADETGDQTKAEFYRQEGQESWQELFGEFKKIPAWQTADESIKNIFTFLDSLMTSDSEQITPEQAKQLANVFESTLTQLPKENLSDLARYLQLLPAILSSLSSSDEDRQSIETIESVLKLWDSPNGLDLDKKFGWLKISLRLQQGDAYLKIKQPQHALDSYQQALQKFDSATTGLDNSIKLDLKAQLMRGLGRVYATLGFFNQSRESFEQAVSLWQNLDDNQEIAEASYRVAQLELERGDPVAAYNRIKTVIQKTEDAPPSDLKISPASGATISRVSSGFNLPGSRGSFVAAIEFSKHRKSKLETLGSDEACTTLTEFLVCRQKYYQFYVDLLMHSDIGITAFEISERARSYSPEIFRSPSKSASADSLFIPVSHPPVPPDSVFAKPLKLAEIQKQLDRDTVLLEYFLGEKQTYLWLVSATGIETHILPDAPKIIDAKAREFYDLLTSPIGRVRPQETAKVGKELSQMLLGPISQKLQGQRLLIVSDGVLQYVPFGALPNPTPIETGKISGEFASYMQPLLVEHEVVTLPSASTLAAIRQKRAIRPSAHKEIAVFADPVFNRQDERYQALLQSAPVETPVKAESSVIPEDLEAMYPRLQGSRQEADGILKSVPAGKETSTYLGFDANLQKALSPELAQYRIIHFATHGLFNTKSPQRSGLVLSTFANGTQPGLIPSKLFEGRSNGILSALDKTGALRRGLLSPTNAFEMKLSAADLVVLSGCRTGLGQDIRGEGLVGLTGGLMAAGAERVVVSLWSVQDTATTKLMTDFYQRMLDTKHPQYTPSPAKALRGAQLAMWNDPQWQTPYYWAAFTIQGEWQ